MADDEVRPPGDPAPGPATPNRGKPREPAQIEGTAEDLTAPSGMPAADPREDAAAPWSAREPATATEPDSEMAARRDQPAAAPRRSMMPALLAVIGLVLIVLLGLNLYTMYVPPGSDRVAEVSGNLGQVDRRVAALEAKPASSVDLAPLDARIKTVEAAVDDLKSGLAETRQKLEALPAPVTPSASVPADADRVAALEAKVNDLGQGLSGVQAVVAALPKVDLAPLDAKVTSVAAGLAGVQSTLAALPKVDLGPMEAKIVAVEGRVKPLEAAFAAPKVTTEITEARQAGSAAEARAAPLAVAAQSVLQAIDDGKPFGPEVAALQSLGTDEARLAALKPVAAKGAPTAAELLAGFAAVRKAVIGAAAPPVTGTVLDRMMASAESFVKVRPAGASPGSDPAAIVSRIDADLAAGAFKPALDEWAGLPDVSKAASQAWADQLKARVGAEAAARAIVTGAITALGPTQ